MIEIGRLAVKIAGRDAGLKCVVVDILDDKFVLIDGETRRRKCNILHIEPLKDVLKIKKKASHEDVKKEFEKLGLKIWETKPKQKTQKPLKKRKTPEQLKKQKEEKKKHREISKPKKKEEKLEQKGTLEEKAALMEDKKEELQTSKNLTGAKESKKKETEKVKKAE